MVTVQHAAQWLGVFIELLYELCQEQVLEYDVVDATDSCDRIRLRLGNIANYRQLCRLDAADLLPAHFCRPPCRDGANLRHGR